MRMLIGMGMFEEACIGIYIPLPLASAYVSKSPLSAAVIHV
jgi:hypothetical protein